MDFMPAMSNMLQPRDLVAMFNYSPISIEEGPPEPIAVHLATKLADPLPREAQVHDIRYWLLTDLRSGTEEQYTLDTTGFQIIKHVSVESDFISDDQIKNVYYREMEAVFKEITGASKIMIFQHTIRRQAFDYLDKASSMARADVILPKDARSVPVPKSLRGPLHTVHVDQSYVGAEILARQHLNASEAKRLLSGRYQIINAWRPIRTILRDPFAVCDAQSVLEEELVPIKLLYTKSTSETFSVRPPLASRTDDGHKWCYLHRQTPEEVLMFKIFDSKLDVARRVPHSAFVDREYLREAPRESLEVRAFCFYEEST